MDWLLKLLLDDYYTFLFWGAIALGLSVVLKVKRRRSKIGGGFEPIEFINSKAEQNFFVQLQRKLPQNLYILCKVRLADVCLPSNRKNIAAFNKVARKHVDFVVVDMSSSKIRFAIELDDKSHARKDSIQRDREKDYALKAAKVPFFRVKATRNYSSSIDGILEHISAISEKPIPSRKPLNEKSCPRCPSMMNLIKMKGFNRGKGYYLCDDCGLDTAPFPID